MRRVRRWVLAASFTLLLAGLCGACTGIRLTAADGATIIGRTMEFGVDMESDLLFIPRGLARTGTGLGNAPGLKWTTKYAALGMNGLGLPVLVDGLNEKGLYVGAFYFPDFAKYQQPGPNDATRVLAPWELPTYLLTTTGSVAEAVEAAKGVVVAPVVFEKWKFCPPVHYRLEDASGKAAVIEYLNGEFKVFDNPVSVLTNSPAFDWHMINLRNYVGLSATSVKPLEIDKLKVSPLGQGNGMIGLPGDFTPPSRFVRAVAFSQAAIKPKNAAEGVKQAFHILNNFDIPKGAARGETMKSDFDYTQWSAVHDLTNKKFYFSTYDNPRVRMASLSQFNADAKEHTIIPIRGEGSFEPVQPVGK